MFHLLPHPTPLNLPSLAINLLSTPTQWGQLNFQSITELPYAAWTELNTEQTSTSQLVTITAIQLSILTYLTHPHKIEPTLTIRLFAGSNPIL